MIKNDKIVNAPEIAELLKKCVYERLQKEQSQFENSLSREEAIKYAHQIAVYKDILMVFEEILELSEEQLLAMYSYKNDLLESIYFEFIEIETDYMSILADVVKTI